ncbi:hypothetical protein N9C96_02725 [bacterium]|nr:hypothetical protein [bacterium]
MDYSSRLNKIRNEDSKFKYYAIAGILVALIILLGLSAILIQAITGGLLGGKNTDKITSNEVKARVAELIIVDQANPTVAEITDGAALRQDNPELYGDVQTGDYLLVYSDKAIIYSPDQDKLVTVAPISLTGIE